MAKIVQMHGMATSAAAVYVGPQREVIVDTGANALRVQDGATPGGFVTMQGGNNLSEITNPASARGNIEAAPIDGPNFTTVSGPAEVNGNAIVTANEFGTGVLTLLGGAASGTGGPAGTISPIFTGTATFNTLNVITSASNAIQCSGITTTVQGFEATGFGFSANLNFNGSIETNDGSGLEIVCVSNGVILNNGATSWASASSREYKKNHEDIENPIAAIKQYVAGLGHYLEDDDNDPKRPFLYYEDAVNAFPAATHFRPAQTLTEEREVQVGEEIYRNEEGGITYQPVFEKKIFTKEIPERKSLSLEQHVPLLIAGMQALIKYIEERDNVRL